MRGLKIFQLAKWQFCDFAYNKFSTLIQPVTIMEKTVGSKEKTRYNGRIKKRRWEENRSNIDINDQVKKECIEPFVRIKKRKYAMLLGYSGVDYQGMQRNPDIKSIEEDLIKALLANDYITYEAFDQLQNIQFQRAARTDKGVSAARQIVSLKLPEEIDISKINEHLPLVIRVFSLKRVTKGFNSKSNCDARTYTYMLPTYSFENRNTIIDNYIEYRTTSEIISNVNNVLKKYLGTHNFHNFTSKKHFIDPSSKRYIITIECESPFIARGMEFSIIKIKGQSFMLHQIRKMVGLCIAIIRGFTNIDIINKAFESDDYGVPTAPALGLMLEHLHFDRYNKRYGSDGMHEKLIWEEVDNEVNTFKEKYIHPNIINKEVEDLQMLSWLDLLPYHSYDPMKQSKDDAVDDVSDEEDDEPVSDKVQLKENDKPISDKIKPEDQNSETIDESIKK